VTERRSSRELELWRAYEQTIFRVFGAGEEIRFQVGEAFRTLDELLDRHGATTWAHITAWNPASNQLPAAENERRQGTLVAGLRQAGFTVLDGDGIDPGGRWPPEPTAFVIGIRVEEARRFGRDYGQLAIVAGERGQPARLVACFGEDDAVPKRGQ
jgi:hypothetical protein